MSWTEGKLNYTWGRSGATIAPDINSGHGRGFSSAIHILDLIDFDPDCGDQDQMRDWAVAAEDYLKAFRLINEWVDAAVKDIPCAWKEYKEDCPEVFEKLKEDDEEEEPDWDSELPESYRQAVNA